MLCTSSTLTVIVVLRFPVRRCGLAGNLTIRQIQNPRDCQPSVNFASSVLGPLHHTRISKQAQGEPVALDRPDRLRWNLLTEMYANQLYSAEADYVWAMSDHQVGNANDLFTSLRGKQ